MYNVVENYISMLLISNRMNNQNIINFVLNLIVYEYDQRIENGVSSAGPNKDPFKCMYRM